MEKIILVTGGSGVIGSLFLPKLLLEYKVLAIGTNHSAFPESIRFHKNFKFYERDLAKINSPEDFLIQEQPDLIWHMAAVVSGSKVSEALYHKINVESTKHLLTFAKKNNVKHFGFLSSITVYGSKNQNLEIISPREGTTIYAKTKILAEDLIFGSGIPYSIFRLASVYGGSSKSFVSKLTQLFRKKIYPYVETKRKKSIVHLEDVVEALLHWTNQSLTGKPTQPIYVLSHPASVTISDVLTAYKLANPQKKFLIPIPVGGVFAFLIQFLFRTLAYVKRKPYHGSPLTPILESIEVYDAASWKKLEQEPKWDLRKAMDSLSILR
ncbi:NAD(P)-dependent oxidoreductase [Leptospira sp. 96542]|nr:NAD(P)-dependent oxidoreductase [Leptospira sp. 96542]